MYCGSLSSVLTSVKLTGMWSVLRSIPVWMGFNHSVVMGSSHRDIWLTDNLAYVCQDQSGCIYVRLCDGNHESCGLFYLSSFCSGVFCLQRFRGGGTLYSEFNTFRTGTSQGNTSVILDVGEDYSWGSPRTLETSVSGTGNVMFALLHWCVYFSWSHTS